MPREDREKEAQEEVPRTYIWRDNAEKEAPRRCAAPRGLPQEEVWCNAYIWHGDKGKGGPRGGAL